MSLNVDNSLWRMQTSDGTKVKLLSRKGSVSRDSGSAEEVYLLRAEDLLDFLKTGLPIPAMLYGGVSYPGKASFYGIPGLVVDTINWEGWDDGKPVDPFGYDPHAPDNTYDQFVKATVTYKPIERAESEDEDNTNDPFTFLSVTSNATGELIAVKASNAWWYGWGEVQVPNPLYNGLWGPEYIDTWLPLGHGEVKDVDIPATIRSPLTEWTVTWPRIPFEYFYTTLLPRLRATIGTVNSSIVPIFGYPPPNTILFIGYSTSEEHMWYNESVITPPITLEMKFLEKNFLAPNVLMQGGQQRVTWQSTWRDGIGWEMIRVGVSYDVNGNVVANSGSWLYTETEHNAIWSAL